MTCINTFTQVMLDEVFIIIFLHRLHTQRLQISWARHFFVIFATGFVNLS